MHNSFKIFSLIIVLVAVLFGLVFPAAVFADDDFDQCKEDCRENKPGETDCDKYCKGQISVMDSVSSDCKNSGTCSLSDMARLLVGIARIILGLVGSLALLMFVYGGATLLFSAGNSDAVSRGKQIIISAVIGLAIVFASAAIIQFTMTALGYTGKDSFLTAKSFN